MKFDLVMFGIVGAGSVVVLVIASIRASRPAPPIWMAPTYDPPNRLRPRVQPYDWQEEDDRLLSELLRDDAEPA